MSEDDWTMGEVVRNLGRIAASLERVETKVDGLHSVFVPREVHARDVALLRGRLDEMGLTMTDLNADYTRFRAEQADKETARAQAEADRAEEDRRHASGTWQFWAGILLTAALTVVSSVVATRLTMG